MIGGRKGGKHLSFFSRFRGEKKNKVNKRTGTYYSTVLWIMCAVFSAHRRDKSSSVYFRTKIKRPTRTGPITRRFTAPDVSRTFHRAAGRPCIHIYRYLSRSRSTKKYMSVVYFVSCSFFFFFIISKNWRCFDFYV